MSSSISDLSDESPPPPRRRQVESDDEDENPSSPQSDSPPSKPAAKTALDDMFSDEDEEEAPKPRRKQRQASPGDSGDDLKDGGSDLGDDLFGDGSDQDMDDAGPSKKTLNDEELDSGDDLDADPRRRLGGDPMDELSEEERDETSYEVDIGLHKLPKASDNEIYLLKIPQFVSIAPQIFTPSGFREPKLPPDAAITPYTFATSAVRWRRSEADPSKLESNSRIIQWSDGSFSLEIGSAQNSLYDLPTNPLIPPQDAPYNPALDSFTFLAEPLANSRLVRFFTHATQSMAVVPASDNIITDDIKQMVAARYKATQKRTGDQGVKKVELSYKIEDPEKARREAEAAEREAEKFRKKLEAQKQKEQTANGLKRNAFRRDHGLSGGDLEDGVSSRYERSGGGSYYRNRKEDDYDEDDGFVEADPDSDEEEEIIDDDSEEEEEYESSRRREKKKNKKEKSKKRREEPDEDDEPEAEFTDGGSSEEEPTRPKSPSKPKARSVSEVDEDEDADGEVSKARERKRRRLVMDDSDEE
ncbi:hypothetical protein ABW19_dt0206365 [Dactylella cylindrospora]|nr:hypothetical protein ABW19_dt0206365 [Dactylella cylindrospora]